MLTSKVFLSLLSHDQEFQTLQGCEGEAAAKRAGLDLETVFAKNNGNLQREQLYRCIHLLRQQARPSAVVAQTVAADGLPKVARDAAAAGIGWILLNRDLPYVDELRAEFPQVPIGIVTIDQVAIGRIQGRQLRALLPDGGRALYVLGPPESVAATQRLEGLQDVIAGAGIDLQILDGDWTAAGGEKAVCSWLRLSTSRECPPELIAAQNDAMAMGARKAMVAALPEWQTRPVIGCDGLADGGRRLVDERTLAATIVVQPTAGVAVDLVALHFGAGAPLPARTVLEPKPYPAVL